MPVQRLKSMLCTLVALWCRCGIAACGDGRHQHEPLQVSHRFLREMKTNRSGIIDDSFSRAGDSNGHGGIAEGPGFFLLNDKYWTSEEQFVQGGGRCQTARPSDTQRARHNADLKSFRISANNDDQRQRRLQTTITVYINWVVISHSNGAGTLTEGQMDSQVNVLNSAFAPQFRFQVFNVQRVVDDDLFTCTRENEWVFSQTYRTAHTAVLNLFTCYPPGTLGWSRYPYGGNAGTVWDLVVVAYNSVPGGNLGPYSYGHVSTVAQNHHKYNSRVLIVSQSPFCSHLCQ
jgi:hypothetical protein